MNAYLDASAILRVILREPGGISDWAKFDVRVSSDLAEVECLRALDRLRVLRELDESEVVAGRSAVWEFLKGMERIAISPPILRRASETFSFVIGTLDAIHLSTALSWREVRSEELSMATHDKALGLACRAYGMPVIGV